MAFAAGVVATAAAAAAFSYHFGVRGPFPPLKGSAHLTGTVEEGFEDVRKVFLANFESGDEIGSGLVVYVGSKKVVEIYGGHADVQRKIPFTKDTLHPVFSSGKVAATLVIAQFVEKGLLDYDAPVAKYWPEFAQGGKENVLLKQLCAHRGGVGWLDENHIPSVDETLDLDRLAARIAGQPHNFNGEPVAAYHGLTRGWYLNEIVRRVDPLHRSIGTIIREEWNPKLGMEMYFGLPDSVKHRYSPTEAYPTGRLLLSVLVNRFRPAPSPSHLLLFDMVGDQKSPTARMIAGVPKYKTPWPRGDFGNAPELLASDSPSFGGVANALTLARMAALVLNQGTFNGVKMLSPETIQKMSTKMEPPMYDRVLHVDPGMTIGGFGNVDVGGHVLTGWGGAGGSMTLWDEEHKVAIGYGMNGKSHLNYPDIPRNQRLIRAIMTCVFKYNSLKT